LRNPTVVRSTGIALALASLAWVPGETATQGWDYWAAETMPVPYFITANASSIAPYAEGAIRRGIEQWGSVPTSYFATTYQGLTLDYAGRSTVQFQDLGGNQTGGMGWDFANVAPSGRRFPVRFLVNLDDDRAGSGWDQDTMSKTSAHELGHTMSLSHSPIPEAVMYFASHSRWMLHQDEIDAASFLHAAPARRPIAWWRTTPLPQAGGMLRIATPAVVTFDASASYDPDGTIVEYRWTFGDGSTQSTAAPVVQHTYGLGSPTSVLPVLEVVDDTGHLDRVDSILIQPLNGPDTAPPSITITAPSAGASFSTTADMITIGGNYADDLGAFQGRWESSAAITPPQGHFNLFLSGTSGSWQIANIPLVLGSNLLTVYLEDYPGNLATDVIEIVRLLPDADAGASDATSLLDATTPADDAGLTPDAGADDAGEPTDAATLDANLSADADVVIDASPAQDGATDADPDAEPVDTGPATRDAMSSLDGTIVAGDAMPAAADGSSGDRPDLADAANIKRDEAGRSTGAALGGGCGCTTHHGAEPSSASWISGLALALLVFLRRRERLVAIAAWALLVGCWGEAAPRTEAQSTDPVASATWHERHVALWRAFVERTPDLGPRLQSALQDIDPRNRRAAAEILGFAVGLDRSTAVEALRARLEDADPFVREATVTSIGQLRARELVDELHRLHPDDPLLATRRWAALVAIDDARGLAWLQQALSSARAEDRAQAATALGLAGTERADRLIALLADEGRTGGWRDERDPDRRGPERVRHLAARALRQLMTYERACGRAFSPVTEATLIRAETLETFELPTLEANSPEPVHQR